MRKDITDEDAKIIAASVRRRKQKDKLALFSTNTGFTLKRYQYCKDVEIGSDEFIGVYTKKSSYRDILEDWNDTI